MITEIFDSTLSPIPTISKFNNKRTTDVIQINNVLNRETDYWVIWNEMQRSTSWNQRELSNNFSNSRWIKVHKQKAKSSKSVLGPPKCLTDCAMDLGWVNWYCAY